MLALVVFPATMVCFGLVTYVLFFREHRKYMNSIRVTRAQQREIARMSAAASREGATPRVVLTNVMSDGPAVMIGYMSPYEASSVTHETVVAWDNENASAVELLQAWCAQSLLLWMSVDPRSRTLLLASDDDRVVLSMMPSGKAP